MQYAPDDIDPGKTCFVLEFISALIRMKNDSLALGKHEKWCIIIAYTDWYGFHHCAILLFEDVQ